MKFTLDARTDVNLIRGYGDAVVRVGERSVPMPCILSADTLISDWDAPRAEDLAGEHLARVWALEPEVILLGTGSRQRFAPTAVREACAARGIGLESMDLGAACRTYNILVQEERRVVAVLFAS